MAEKAVIRRCRTEEWRALRELRLLALRADRMAFGSTFDGESSRPFEMWRERARNGAEGVRSATFVAEEPPSGRLVGMGGILPSMNPNDPLGFHIVGMWVRPECRGGGLGGRILEALLDFGRTADADATVHLDVNPEQRAAVRLYKRHGFVATGRTEPLDHTPTIRIEEMTLSLERRPK